jgi:DNA mismatch repair protein MutS
MSTSPMMKQYEDAKAACPDALLLFRMGDFYELFHDDAKTAARVLGLALTSRDKGENPVPMAGFPHHQLESYLGKLIASGMRVAICDQVEDAKLAKGLVRREVTRVVTAGTVTDDALLDPRASNYLAALVVDGPSAGLAWVDVSTGRFLAGRFATARIGDELARIAPAECLVNEDADVLPSVAALETQLTKRPAWAFASDTAGDTLNKHFAVASLEGFGFQDDDGLAIRAAGAVLGYLIDTQRASLTHIDRVVRYSPGETLEIDAATRRSLEVTCTYRDGRREGSLLDVIDRTVTAMGSRLLADWLSNPMAQIAPIDERLDAVAELVADAALANALQDQLRDVYDLERLLTRVTTGRASPRDLSFVGRTLCGLPQLKAKITARQAPLLQRLEAQLDLCCEVRAALEKALQDDCPLNSREGGFIRDGFSADLDGLRDLTKGGKQWIANYQAAESERSGIPSLKVGFNKVFGYYLEITHTHSAKIPEHYIRKQTVKNAERYITPELKEYEERVLSADEKAQELEYKLFCELRETVAADAPRIARSGRAGATRRAGIIGRPGAASRLLSTDDGGRAGARDRRRAASGARRTHRRRLLRPQRHGLRAGRRIRAVDYRPEHVGQEHVHTPGGADHAYGANGQLCAGAARHDRHRRPHLCARGRQRRIGSRAEHLHGRDDRKRAYSQQRHAPKPGDSGRDRPRHQHVRRIVAGLGRDRVFARRRGLPHLVCHTLSRVDHAGGVAARRAQLQRGGARMAGTSRVPA